MTATLNGPLIRRRRIEASVGLHHAAFILGVGTPTLSRIESGDTPAMRSLSVAGLLRLAEAIGCSPTDLFLDPTPPIEPSTNGTVDPELLIGVLHESPTQVSIKDLASAFAVKNADIRAAAQRAQERLAETGLRVGHRDDKFFLTPTRQTDVTDRLTLLQRTTIGRFGISNGQARVLRQVLDGKLTTGRKSTYTQNALLLLTRIGMLTTTEAGHTPSEALTYALDVP